jgi:hypothetical protein
MKVFISWSGPKSESLAEKMRNWIPSVIQAAKPYFSPDDIEKGTRWYPEISKELEESRVGIICLTRDNLDAPWILFEAGALAKTVEKSRIITVLFGLRPSDLKGPLSQFQSAVFGKNEIKKVLKTINTALGDEALESTVLEKVFEKWWPDLESDVKKVMEDDSHKKKQDLRNDREILEEILQLTRAINIETEFSPIHSNVLGRIDEFELPVPVANKLKECNFTLLGELVQHNESELIRTFDFNKKIIDAIKKELLAPLGLSLGMRLDR